MTDDERLRDRVCTVADEANGPHPVQSAEDALTCIERALFDRHRGQTGAIQDLQAQLTAWRTATGCDTPETANAIALFLRWVLDEDERRVLREFRAAWVEHDDVLNMGDPSGPSLGRFKAAKREMQRRGF